MWRRGFSTANAAGDGVKKHATGLKHVVEHEKTVIR
jgi:hypothetical protein